MKETRAFTLLELVIVLSVILLLTASTLVAINSFGDRQKLKTEAASVVSLLRKVRQQAVAVDVGSCEDRLISYKVTLGANQMTITQVCSGGSNEQLNLSNLNFCDNQEINFMVPSGSVGGDVVANLCYKGQSKYKITITQTGSVSDAEEVYN